MRERVVRREIRAHLGAAADDAQEAGCDERRERALEHGHQGILGGVDLEQYDAVVREQLVQHVEHGDRSDVAGAEHEADPAVGSLCFDRLSNRSTDRGALCEPRPRPRVAGRHAGGEPDLAGEAGEQQLVDPEQREGVHPGLTARGAVDPHVVQGVAAVRDPVQRLDVGVERAQGRVGAAQPLLAAEGVIVRQLLRADRRARPLARARRDGTAHAA